MGGNRGERGPWGLGQHIKGMVIKKGEVNGQIT